MWLLLAIQNAILSEMYTPFHSAYFSSIHGMAIDSTRTSRATYRSSDVQKKTSINFTQNTTDYVG